MPSTAPPKTSALFRHIEQLQGDAPWGAFLDAGTGVNSALWSSALATDRWCAVTGSAGHGAQVQGRVGARLRAQDRLIVGNWTDPELLAGEGFDTVLADYLVGAVEGFSPYFQPQLFARLRPSVKRRLYVVGLDPYVVGEAPTKAARVVRDIGRLRDAVLLLAGETPYREFPAEWVVNALQTSGYRVTSGRRFANRYRQTWVNGQLDMAARRLARFADPQLAAAMENSIEALRERSLDLCRRDDGLAHGHDYVVAAEPA
ncbi:MAG: hypothetical protein C0481_16920 [Phenylobacterium sp.]|uniref:hypothetical protein n=1 Tax=Phenylobacterium sp. TaxID=1871053 RepID=UPI0025EC3F58|nr:hypothetical protein [Phenylobacterium sp.]MBA4013547.1 hypothetical protein [Phenylobacterium sp.]